VREVLIADDHPLFRDALKRAVQTEWPHALLHEADSIPALQALIDAHPDAELLLLDLHIPGASGFSALVQLRAQHPGLPIVMVSAHEEASVIARAVAHGASGYIPKSASIAAIVEAVHDVLAGGIAVPDGLPRNDALPAAEADAAARIAELTPQQLRVLAMIAEGLLNKQIAWDLGVSEATVKAHMTAIMRKLGVGNRTQVALLASQLALDGESRITP
jgi:DNA-binding NarL/FixJ family response regulator